MKHTNHFDCLYTSTHHVRAYIKPKGEQKMASREYMVISIHGCVPQTSTTLSTISEIWLFKLRVVLAEIHILNIDNTHTE